MASAEAERRDRAHTGDAGVRGRPDRSARESVRRRKLLRAAQRGDRGARERLVATHLGLIRSIAARYRDLGLPFEDLVQEGALGLLEAIDRYDPCRSPAFESYARFRVRRAIRNALTDQARLIRLPKQIVERRRAIERAEARLAAAARPAPTPTELAAATGLPIKAVLEARGAGVAPVSLDAPVLPDGSPLEALVPDPAAGDPEHEALEREQIELLITALQNLPARERRIVSARWGLAGPPQSLVELAAELGLSPRRAQTIAAHALHELRAELESSAAVPVARTRRAAGALVVNPERRNDPCPRTVTQSTAPSCEPRALRSRRATSTRCSRTSRPPASPRS